MSDPGADSGDASLAAEATPSRLALVPAVAIVVLSVAALALLPRRPPTALVALFAIGCVLVPAIFLLIVEGLRPLVGFLVTVAILVGAGASTLATTEQVWLAAGAMALLGCLAGYGIHRLSRVRLGLVRGEDA